jgi:hypothetical protein
MGSSSITAPSQWEREELKAKQNGSKTRREMEGGTLFRE